MEPESECRATGKVGGARTRDRERRSEWKPPDVKRNKISERGRDG